MSTLYIRYPGEVTSLNNETGAITLVAGPGITITPSSQSITITNTEAAAPVLIGPLDSQPENANGLAIVTNVLSTQSADTTHPGMVNNTTQSFSGNKTFTGSITASNFSGSSSGTNTGDVTLGTPNGLSITGQVLSLGLSSTSTTGALSSTDWNTFNNKQSTLTLGNLTDTGTDGIVVTGGTGAVVGTGTSLAQHVADTTHNGYLSSTDWNTFNGKQAAGNYITALTGDVTASGPGSVAATLATVNGNVGSFGSSTSIPNFTVNAKGLITAAGSNVVIAPAGTLTGTTLASNVVSSSLTSVGTITSGTWNGTTIAILNGGTGQTTKSTAFDALSPMTTGGDIIYGGASGTGTRLANGTNGQVLTSSGGTSAPTWQTPTGGSGVQMAIFNDTEASGTDGGGFTSGVWQNRTLNTTVQSQSWASLSSSTVTLSAGTYYVEASAPAYFVQSHQVKFRDTTNNVDAILGTTEYSAGGTDASQTRSFLQGVITIAGSTNYLVQHQCSTTKNTNGLGVSSSFGVNIVFTMLSITKLA